MARFLAVFGEGKSGGKKIGERKGFQLIEVIWEVPKTGRECQKFSFWQNGDTFGRIWECFWHFGRDFWQITVVRFPGSL